MNGEILIVDDSEIQAEYLKRVLQKRNIKAQTANSTDEALVYLKDNTPSLIITDVVMPNISGFELCRRIKQDPKTSNIPVILLTALSEPEDIIKGLIAGADNFITKPYSNDFLFSRIDHCLLNSEISRSRRADMGIEIFFGGKKYLVKSNSMQILDLLLSTYESVLEKNRELQKTIRQLEDTKQKLLEAKEVAEIANRYKSEFLANMSHEIRTPMNIILGIADGMLDSGLPEEHKASLKLLRDSASSLLALLNDILDLSKVESGRMELSLEDMDLYNLLTDIETLFKIPAGAKGLEFNVAIDKSLPRLVKGDSTRIRQVLTNLISNAIKFTEKGYVKVNARLKSLENGYVTVLFSVADSGIGISEHKQEFIFDAFVQADGTTTRRYGGTGLGLSICKGLTDMMGGKIWVESETGKGSVFYCSIPMEVVEKSSAEAIKEPHNLQLHNNVKPLSILIVDDNDLNLIIAERLLTRKGHMVSTAKGGAEALDMILKNPYDLVFMDVNMPDMDGIETTERLRQKESDLGRPHTPVVAMTAYAIKEVMEQCLKAGMDDYISKPIDIKALEKILLKASNLAGQ